MSEMHVTVSLSEALAQKLWQQRTKSRVRRATAMAVLAAAAVAVSCGGDSGIRIEGRLLRADGSPAAGVNLGFTAFADVFYRGETDGDGHYAFVASSVGTDGMLHAYLSGQLGDALIGIAVQSSGDDVSVPTIKEWAPALTIAKDGAGDSTVTWAKPPDGIEPSYRVELAQGEPDWPVVPLWRSDVLDSPMYRVPPEVAEDHAAIVRVTAGNLDDCGLFDRDICVTQQSTWASLPLGSIVPLSRGATCTVGNGDLEEPLLTFGRPPCPITDGLVTTAMFTCPARGCPEDVVINLGAETTVNQVVVHSGSLEERGGSKLVVETSLNGAIFDEAASFDVRSYWDFYALVPFEAPVQARFVRLHRERGNLKGLADVAVF